MLTPKTAQECSSVMARLAALLLAACSDESVAPASPPDPSALPETPASLLTSIRIQDERINEASGLVVSSLNPGVAWVHNDSGDSARVFAVDLRTGETRATLTYSDEPVVDVEDIALDRHDPDGPWLYLGDIGDNLWLRDSVAIYRVREPDLATVPNLTELRTASERMSIRYPIAPKRGDIAYDTGAEDAETLLHDPLTGDLYIATKTTLSARVLLAGTFEAGADRLAIEAGAIAPPSGALTGGDISPDGRSILLRDGIDRAFVWARSPPTPIGASLSRAPDAVLRTDGEVQGEGLGFLPDRPAFATIAEGDHEAIHTWKLSP